MLYSRSKIPQLNLGEGFSKGFIHGQKSLNPSPKFRCGIFQRLFSRSKIPHLNLGEEFSKGFIHGQKSLT
jgi:hypothetical protein